MQIKFYCYKYENVNTNGIKQGYKIRSYLKQMLNKLNVIGGFALGDLILKRFHGGFHVLMGVNVIKQPITNSLVLCLKTMV
jgi:preprotein translocase subunit SecY